MSGYIHDEDHKPPHLYAMLFTDGDVEGLTGVNVVVQTGGGRCGCTKLVVGDCGGELTVGQQSHRPPAETMHRQPNTSAKKVAGQ
eukprot:m.114665 g.114665  ORF g.114665 m.114665 type:complete len:85 (-) comp10852_c0_seq2:264-518(-)